MLQVTINGQSAAFPKGTTILKAARTLGIDIPTLCHDDRLKPSGACRICAVEVRGWNRLASACSTSLAAGMEIETESPLVLETRSTLLRLLARNYPANAVRDHPDKPFHRLLRDNNIDVSFQTKSEMDDSHPYIAVDMARCVRCFRCARICDELQGQFVWQAWGRGDQLEIKTSTGNRLRETSCVSCGACVDTCPTGALEDKSILISGPPKTWTRSVCPYCGAGCEILVGTAENRIAQIKPVAGSPVNHGHLCVKGRYAFAFNNAADRVTHPMVRRDGTWDECSWPHAIGLLARKLTECVQRYGPDSVGILSSSRGTNEENYLAQKFARVVLGTNNVDCCARVCHAPTATAMSEMLGAGAATNSFADIERAGSFLICGCNPTENHPVVGERIKQAVLNGAKLIVIDPRRIELAEYADAHLALRPGTNIPLLNALASAIIEENLVAEAWVRARVSQFSEFKSFVGKFSPERVSPICGVPAKDIRRAARLYAQTSPAMCFHGLGVTEHLQGVDGVKCLTNLALITGNIGKPGCGVNPLRGQNNVQGAAHMGCEPSHLTGYASIESGRERFEKAWATPLPLKPGMDLSQMMDAAAEGRFKALWVIGYDIALTNPNAGKTAEALNQIDFVVVQDLFSNATAAGFSSLFLPAASSFEKDGTFMNSERRVQLIRRAMDPPGDARADWQIICEVARAMGKGEQFAFCSAEEIWEEIRSLWPAGRGITYERLAEEGLQWPCPEEQHAGMAILHQDRFACGPRASLACIDLLESAEKTGDAFPFLLTTGRTLFQFNAGTMTQRTRNAELRPLDTLDISPEDAETLAIHEGDQVRVISRHGEATLPARIDSRMQPSCVFATFHNVESLLNQVTGNGRDFSARTPEYKVVAVRIEKAG